MHGEGGVMLLSNQISAHTFERLAHESGDARFTVNDQDFLAKVHNDGRLRASPVPLRGQAGPDSIKLARLESSSDLDLSLPQAGHDIDGEGENYGVECK